MAHLSITLFGGFQATLDDQPLTDFKTDKNRALLAYLALESGGSHRREELASLLWADHGESGARNSLRQSLFQLRRVIDPREEAEPHLRISANQVQLNPASDLWTDAVAFKRCLEACMPRFPADLSLSEASLDGLQHAVDLYQGELLAGLTLPHCAQFTEWQVISQEFLHRQALAALSLLADYFEANLEYEQLIAWTQRAIALEPWRETAYRKLMWALIMTGQREQALRQYKALQEVLQREMGIAPTDGTRRLYEQIRDGCLPGIPLMPVPIPMTGQPARAGGPVFAGRQAELAKLDGFLNEALAGQGRVAAVSGEAGSGKTALLNEFARAAMRAHRGLLVAGGECSAYRGLGDPFQPFREILEALVGMAPLPYAGSVVTPEAARRLSAARPVLLQALLEEGPGLAAALLSPPDLLQRARETPGLDAGAVSALERLAARPTTRRKSAPPGAPAEASRLARANLYEQAARFFLAVSRRFPLLVLLDNAQWLDRESASLLFSLGGHLAGGRTLLVLAYREEDLACPRGAGRHPLGEVLHEFQRRFGEIRVDLSRADGRAFVDALLDERPNRFDAPFREALYRHSGGNALYAEELLAAMQARGELAVDSAGCWTQAAAVRWDALPARIEAVFAERLSRIDDECLALLRAAAAQGACFTTGALARALHAREDTVIERLSGPLCKQHLLEVAPGPAEREDHPAPLYRFRSLLLQEYLQIPESERA